ncbi:MAG: 16S rRNA (uracil(1498)-N(3))-methyltransferase [Gemmatimonadales bacterium]|nr:16S rRNA (uracil(1498)-N(3))-methyltransferase [Gemmatimonadales bacterium]
MITVMVPPGEHAVGGVVELDDEESHHLQVRRVREGERCTALDGAGAVIEGPLQRGMRRWQVAIDKLTMHAPPAGTILAVAAGDRDRFLLLAEKAGELGVTRIIPLVTARQRSVETRLRDVVLDRVRRRALEACKQSGNPWIPDVDPITPLEELTRGSGWFVAAQGGASCPTIAAHTVASWLIGPEGGWTEPESEFIHGTLGAIDVGLGQFVLRFETAAIAAAVLTIDRRARA